MRRAVGLALSLAVMLAGACGGSDSDAGNGGAAPTPAPNTVVLQDIAFKPSSISVKVGDTVTWKFSDKGIPHNVVADDDSFKSDLKDSGTFEHTFDKAGDFGYKCTVHPGMKGSVKVT